MLQRLTDYQNKSFELMKSFINQLDIKKIHDVAKDISTAISNGKRVHCTGIGKPSYVAKYAASLFSSIGTPSYFLDATETTHGSAGQIKKGDIVIVISNSGETEELKPAVETIKNCGGKLIVITGGKGSYLSKQTSSVLYAYVTEEGDELNKAPRASILAEIIVIQILSVALQYTINLSLEDYLTWHPGGALGKSIREMK